MKAITIRPLWAWAIFHAGKDIENRSWRTHVRGSVAVHASKAMSRPLYEAAAKKIKKIAPRANVPPFEAMARGAIVGIVDLVGCEPRTKSKWHARGHYGFVLANPRVLRRPIPCGGRLNFWEIPKRVARGIPKSLR